MSIAVHWNNSQTCYCHANVHIIYHDRAWAVSPGYSLISLTSILSITRLFNWKPVTISTSPQFLLDYPGSVQLLFSKSYLSICGYHFLLLFHSYWYQFFIPVLYFHYMLTPVQVLLIRKSDRLLWPFSPSYSTELPPMRQGLWNLLSF